ncbi:MAG: cobalt ECF transporter T component CbiQ [Pseudonocardia sp.]|uniref:cobalt ECF transporter T component CbiQ n=1 Tax=unclassified Pseudonocardia TaxID=2619320 RepID=UPI000868569B|nr:MULTISPECIES: cobalt ECF transporter T component CbiQ [unclassified Pseudonocardia]MBN9109786.1 cobalt ECF transporter T component CbiQ [Pseudonocardia sp.]ODU26761.1 MAG: cobalt ECF transporter T component CbiQ [Pseudonocardia sp. SCN 72-51]ODV09191.1 MAG: cobalt ECF transporter T component CbiQ [Pseudonocardia sp. SCN 73-27]
MLPLDAAAYTNRWRTRHPGEKALLSLGLLVLAVALPTWPGAAIVGAAALVLVLGPAGLAPRVLWRAVRVPLGFVVTGMLPLLVAIGGQQWIQWDPTGWPRALELGGRAVAALLCLLLFAATTPLADLLPRLEKLGVPPAVTEIASLMYRMLFLLLESIRVIRDAQAGRLGFRTWPTTFRSLTGQGAAIFVRAFDRARRLEQGLASRGYNGSLHVLVPARPVSAPFLIATIALLAAIVTSTLLLAP